MSGSNGTVAWSELMTRDPRSARAFYRAVCGWSWEVMRMPDGSDYHVASADGRAVAGILDTNGVEGFAAGPSRWFTYIAVADVDAAVKAARRHEGKVIRAPFDVPGVGRIAILQDAAGAPVGIMTPAER